MRTFILGPIFLAVFGCQTSGQLTRVDSDKHRYEIQGQDDIRSAMHPDQDSSIILLIEQLSKKADNDHRDIFSRINLAQAYLAIGKLEKSELKCREALRIDLKNDTAKKILAQIYYRRNNLEMATIILNSLDSNREKDSQIMNLRGMIALRNNQPEFALHNFQEALKINPADVAVRMNLGVLYIQFRQIGLAAVELERVLKLMPEHPDAILHLAIIEENRGKLDRAEELNKKVLKNSQNNSIALFNMAVIEERRKNYSKSLDYLKSYLSTDYAKKKNNQEVFAFIDKVRNEQEALTGKKVTDDEIMKLASKKPIQASKDKGNEFFELETTHSKKNELTNQAKNSDQSRQDFPSSDKEQPTDTKLSNPAAVNPIENRKKSYGSDEEEIQDLEKQLK